MPLVQNMSETSLTVFLGVNIQPFIDVHNPFRLDTQLRYCHPYLSNLEFVSGTC